MLRREHVLFTLCYLTPVCWLLVLCPGNRSCVCG
nr:MAG TPA: hypothetical protein [Caudoviricetes sp.]